MRTAKERQQKAKKQSILFGVLSVALYAATFTYADAMVSLYAKGGAYCVLPVATVFLFSYVHGNFTGNVWTALGIEASSKAGKAAQKGTSKTTGKSTGKRTDNRGRAQMSA